MPLDHDVEILLKMIQEANRPSFETVGAVAARELFMAGRKALSPDPMPIAETRDIAIPGPGGAIPARLYRSVTTGILPVLVFFHGGAATAPAATSGRSSASWRATRARHGSRVSF